MSQQECLFCRIAAGEESASKIYADDHCFVFLNLFLIREGRLDGVAALIARRLDD